jgi:hypothetical protein
MSDHDRRPARPVSAQPTSGSAQQERSTSALPSTTLPGTDGKVTVPEPQPLGQYLKTLGFLTGSQLMHALAMQAQRSAARTPISLGALLISQGMLTPQDLMMTLMIQQMDRVQAGAVPATARLGDLLVHGGVITASQCASALYTQVAHERPGMRLRLGQILIAQGLVAPRTLASVLRAQQAAWDQAHAMKRPDHRD